MFQVLFILGMCGWALAAPADTQAALSPDTEEEDLAALSNTHKQDQQPDQQQPDFKTPDRQAQFGFNPQTLKLIAVLVDQAERVAEREYATELLHAMESNRKHQNHMTPELRKVQTQAPTEVPTSRVPTEAKEEEDKEADTRSSKEQVQNQYSQRMKMLLQHLPYPLTMREIPQSQEAPHEEWLADASVMPVMY